jgi:hypothetical protein
VLFYQIPRFSPSELSLNIKIIRLDELNHLVTKVLKPMKTLKVLNFQFKLLVEAPGVICNCFSNWTSGSLETLRLDAEMVLL